MQNRSILELKQKLVPRSGYLNRQAYYLAQNIIFDSTKTDPSNRGILLPHNRCEGRTGTDGRRIRKSSSEALIRVRSIVTSKLGGIVTPDMVSDIYFPADETPEAFGIRCTTAFTESLTQEGLSLKHSGSFVMNPPENRLEIQGNSSGKVELDDNIIKIVNPSGIVLEEYPLPEDFEVVNKTVAGKGSYIGTLKTVTSAGLKLDMMVKIMGAKKAMVDRGIAKNEINLGPSYAPVDGVIKYDFDKGVYFIGAEKMGKIEPHVVYYYPQGARVKKFTRISSQPLNPSFYMKYPLEDAYYIFRDQARQLAGKLTEEVYEVLFYSITSDNPDTGQREYDGSYRSTTKGNKSFFAQLSFERGKQAITKLASGELKFVNDVFTKNILDYMIISAKSLPNERRTK